MKRTGDRVGTTSLCYTEDGVRGEVNIYFPEDSEGGIPEIDYDSGTLVGTGTAKDIFRAIRLVKDAMRDFSAEINWEGKFQYFADDRDGFGDDRIKLYDRYIPEIIFNSKYKEDTQ